MRHFIIGCVGILTFSPFSLGFEGAVGRLEITGCSQGKRAESSPQSSPTGSEIDGRPPMDQDALAADSPLFEIDEVKVITRLNTKTFSAAEQGQRKQDTIIIRLPNCNLVVTSHGEHSFILDNAIKYFEKDNKASSGENPEESTTYYSSIYLSKGTPVDQILQKYKSHAEKVSLSKGSVYFRHYETSKDGLIVKAFSTGAIGDIFHSSILPTLETFAKDPTTTLVLDILIGKTQTTYKASYK